MIKLSKSDWLRIGREQGYLKKQAHIYYPQALKFVGDSCGELHQMISESNFIRDPDLVEAIDGEASNLLDELEKFKRSLTRLVRKQRDS